MLYYLGLSRMSREETIALAVQIKTLTGLNVISDSVRKTSAKAKAAILEGLSGLLDRQGKSEYANHVREADRKIDWNTDTLSKTMDRQFARLSLLNDEQLTSELRLCLKKITGLKEVLDDQAIAYGVLERAARSMGIDPTCYVDAAQLELIVFDTAVQRQCEALEKKLRKLSPEEREKLATILEGELNRLSQSEREAIRLFTGAETLSGQAMLTFLRTLSGVAMAKLAFAGAGFGAFLFLTTAMKATSLLLGVTLSFGTYAAASSLLAFATSAPIVALALGLSGGYILHRTSGRFEDQLAQLVVVTGHWRMSGANKR